MTKGVFVFCQDIPLRVYLLHIKLSIARVVRWREEPELIAAVTQVLDLEVNALRRGVPEETIGGGFSIPVERLACRRLVWEIGNSRDIDAAVRILWLGGDERPVQWQLGGDEWPVERQLGGDEWPVQRQLGEDERPVQRRLRGDQRLCPRGLYGPVGGGWAFLPA